MCVAGLMNRAGLLLTLSGILPIPVCAHVDSTAASTGTPVRRQNAWVSAGIGVGMCFRETWALLLPASRHSTTATESTESNVRIPSTNGKQRDRLGLRS